MTVIDDDVAPGFYPATTAGKPEYDPIDLSARSFWLKSADEREVLYRELRENRPVSWQRPVEDAVTPDPDDPGYWAVTRHADIRRVSLENDVFISRQGVLFDLLPDIFLEMSQSFLAMDDPKHDHLRKLVSSAFTPKQIKLIQSRVEDRAAAIVDDVIERGSGVDFVHDCAYRLPVAMYGDMFGIPESLRGEAASAAADVVAWLDPEVLGDRSADEVQVEACVRLHDIAEELIADHRRHPKDDLMSALVEAEINGRKLDDFEIGSFFVLMSVASTDTTTHTSSYAALGMTDHPEQKRWLMDDYDARIRTAVEEMVRWGSVVMTFRRTVVSETELGGRLLVPGDKVVMFYPSGNRDAEVFDRPYEFDLSRTVNPHLGFGGGGVHYCLGNQLAKTMLTALWRQILTRIPDFHASEPVVMDSNFMRAIKHLNFEFEVS